MTWLSHNFVTGSDDPPEQPYGPTEQWVEGWECYMHNGLSANPYEPGTIDYEEWQSGYDSAERD